MMPSMQLAGAGVWRKPGAECSLRWHPAGKAQLGWGSVNTLGLQSEKEPVCGAGSGVLAQRAVVQLLAPCTRELRERGFSRLRVRL